MLRVKRNGGRYSYRASKAALNQIIKSFACELSAPRDNNADKTK